jgi:nicotinamidase-related amidase
MNPFERARGVFNTSSVSDLQPIDVPDKTLVVIDMQEHYVNSKELHLIPRICSLIKQARQNNWAIILVQLKCSSGTSICEEIFAAVENYPHLAIVSKPGMDGGEQVLDCLKYSPNWSLDLLVCGIYGDQCVAATVEGLLTGSDLVEVSVIHDAVHPEYVPFTEAVGHPRQQIVSMTEVDDSSAVKVSL